MGRKVTLFLSVLVLVSAFYGAALASAGQSSGEVRVAVVLTSMHADLMEGVEEALAYLLLGAVEEKQEFLEKMKTFDEMAAEFAQVSGNRYAAGLAGIMESKGKMQDAALKAFGKLETEEKIELADLMNLENAVGRVVDFVGSTCRGRGYGCSHTSCGHARHRTRHASTSPHEGGRSGRRGRGLRLSSVGRWRRTR